MTKTELLILVIEQIKEDVLLNETESLYCFLGSLLTKNSESIFKSYLPEEDVFTHFEPAY